MPRWPRPGAGSTRRVKDFVNDVFEVGKESIDRVSRRRSIEAAAQPNNRVPKLSFNGTNA
jgi:hypothetical protein